MLKHTFCHLPGIGPVKEQHLWDKGITTWEKALAEFDPSSSPQAGPLPGIVASMEKFAQRDAAYFSGLLPPGQQYRLFKPFVNDAVYLDIETTGLSPWDKITTIAMYDGKQINHYVQGENLDAFANDIKHYALIITFNGKTFDLPFLRSRLNCTLDQAHIDLRYVLASLGFKGGLKKCEKAMGIDRGDLEGVDGSFAVVLWDEFQKTQNPKALETLLAYNIEDVLNLETLMVKAYNLKVKNLAFTAPMPEPSGLANPFSPDKALVDKLKSLLFF
ncbi:MAG: ribonuclease H-like domain-containing protein [Desulfobacter sp.]|nr:ribonuclease H-like domain-containing protein [Desulfobacter sp.]WDP85512.1 MAG: ribonuclease H-like domain-containing protein [Desulfobacter sp.]